MGLVSLLAVNSVTGDDIKPGESNIPGSNVANDLIGGLMFYSLLFCIVGVVLSAGLWAIGSFSQNYTQSVNGKKGFLVCAGAALAIGCAQLFINFFYSKGDEVTG